jgi:hypothetical protein
MEGRMNSIFVLIFGVVVLLLIVFGGGYLLLTNKNTPNTATPTSSTSATTTSASSTTSTSSSVPANSILTADAVSVATSSKKRFADAQARLSAWPLWKSDAQFSGLFMTFDQYLILDSVNEIYVFDSASDASNHYTISVSQASGNSLRALVPKADYQGALLPINSEFWQSNYVDAIQFADKNGGSDFMKTNSVTAIDANLLRTAPNNYLYWVVTYKTSENTNSLTVKMDAKTKTLVAE